MHWFFQESAYEVARLVEADHAGLVEGRTDEERMVTVIDLRLRCLEPYVASWPQAMALGLKPENAPTTARNLALLSDEMCSTVGLTATDARWYTDRAVVGAVYGAAELFMLADSSAEFSETRAFVRRRVAEAQRLASPGSPSRVDAHLHSLAEAVLPKGRGPGAGGAPGLAGGLAALASASVQVALGALGSLAPAGAPQHRSRYHEGAGPDGAPTYSAPPEDAPASMEEMAAFDPPANRSSAATSITK